MDVHVIDQAQLVTEFGQTNAAFEWLLRVSAHMAY